MNFEPMHDIVLIDRTPIAKTTSSGIILAGGTPDKPYTGTVLGVGPGRYSDQTGAFVETKLQAGQHVIFSPQSGVPIALNGPLYDGKDLVIMREVEVVGIISEL